jgi:hypothetical protein
MALPPPDYESIKELAKTLGRSVETLVALHTNLDPFYISPRRQAVAEWFATTWGAQRCGPGTHIRKIHYRLISHRHSDGYVGPDGKPYLNTDRCYEILGVASQDARYLGLVPIEHFDDRRNDAPIELLLYTEQTASAGLEEADPYFGPLTAGIWARQIDVPNYTFTPATINQRYHVELWCEKSTMNAILIDLARRYSLNVVTALGEMSITHCWKLVQRAMASGRPVRILYISDFDPAGQNMPVSCARKIEFFVQRDAPDLDIQLRPIALTHDQCVEYQLPRTPIKDEGRAEEFERRYGEGATELDALEALYPGMLRQILEREIERYHDPNLADAVETAANDFTDQQEAVRDEIVERHQEEMDEIETERADLVRRCNEALDQFREPMARNDERAEALQQTIIEELRDEAPDPDDIDWPEPDQGDEDDDPLFDSTRDYIGQIARFKQHQGKSTTERRPRYVLDRINAQYRERRARRGQP